MTLTEFLLARIAEDEAAARDAGERRGLPYESPLYVVDDNYRHDQVGIYPERVLAECEAKRRIIERGPSECGGYQSEHGLGTHYPAEGWSYCDGCSAAESADLDWQWIMRHLATVYADHEDYRAEWAL